MRLGDLDAGFTCVVDAAMSPQRTVRMLFKNDVRTIIVILYAVGLALFSLWVFWKSTEAPSRTDLQRVVISVCESVNDGHDRSKVSAGIITKQAKVIENIIARASVPRPGDTPAQAAARQEFQKFVNDQEDQIIEEANVFKDIPDTNCNEAK
jgi:hypothetical protein